MVMVKRIMCVPYRTYRSVGLTERIMGVPYRSVGLTERAARRQSPPSAFSSGPRNFS